MDLFHLSLLVPMFLFLYLYCVTPFLVRSYTVMASSNAIVRLEFSSTECDIVADKDTVSVFDVKPWAGSWGSRALQLLGNFSSFGQNKPLPSAHVGSRLRREFFSAIFNFFLDFCFFLIAFLGPLPDWRGPTPLLPRWGSSVCLAIRGCCFLTGVFVSMTFSLPSKLITGVDSMSLLARKNPARNHNRQTAWHPNIQSRQSNDFSRNQESIEQHQHTRLHARLLAIQIQFRRLQCMDEIASSLEFRPHWGRLPFPPPFLYAVNLPPPAGIG